jgi:urease accessory protein
LTAATASALPPQGLPQVMADGPSGQRPDAQPQPQPALSATAAADAGAWLGRLALRYTAVAGRTRAHDLHQGPLRVLQALYPEGPGICHHVLVHPPGGVVAGDRLEVDVQVAAGAHALITTPGATRFYRSAGGVALQQADLRVAADARLEWMPLETLAYPGCRALNGVRLDLEPGAETMGWDLLALGLPRSGQSFTGGQHAAQGWFEQRLEWPGVWLERGRITAADEVLLNGGPGLAGHNVLATMWFAAGAALAPARRVMLLDQARALAQNHALAATAGATAPAPGLVVLRVLASSVEPALHLLRQVRAGWRESAWGLASPAPRVWLAHESLHGPAPSHANSREAATP